MKNANENDRALLRVLPPEAGYMANRGYISFRTARQGPSIAWTQWDTRHRQWAVYVLDQLPNLLDEVQMKAVLRHELAHIFLGHFSKEITECREEDNAVATDTAVNWFMPRDVLSSINETLGIKLVDPIEVQQFVGLSGTQYVPSGVIHNYLHQMVEEARADGTGGGGGEGTGEGHGDTCGGLQGESIPEADKVRAKALAGLLGAQIQADEEASSAYGGSTPGYTAGSFVLPFSTDPTPSWVRSVEEFARSIVRAVLADKRSHARPQQVPRAMGYHSPSLKPRWGNAPDTVCLLVDTSGSMYALLNQVQPAVSYLIQHGLTVRLIAGDVRVTTDEEVTNTKKIPDLVGGGGTEITPLFDRAYTYGPQAIIAFTDGYVPGWPEDVGIDTLWVCGNPVPFGKRVTP